MNRFSWKHAFFALLLLNLIAVSAVVYFLFSPPEQPEMPVYENSGREDGNMAELNIVTNKADLNVLIHEFVHELFKKETKKQPFEYHVLLTDEVELYGTIPVFNSEVGLHLTFSPKALDNGDLILSQSSVKIGKIELPATYVMNFIKNNYRFPEWVEIFPNEQIIYVHLTDIELGNKLKVHANTFDLKRDEISFTLMIDTEK